MESGYSGMASERELVLNPDWCKGCGICVAFCPKDVLELRNEKVAMKNAENCVLCGMCELRCPDYAIYIREAAGGNDQWVKPY